MTLPALLGIAVLLGLIGFGIFFGGLAVAKFNAKKDDDNKSGDE